MSGCWRNRARSRSPVIMTSVAELPPRGPHPLAAQVMAAAAQWLGAVAAFDAWRAGDGAWHPDLADRAAALAAQIDAVGADKVQACLAAEAEARLQQFLAGVEAYRAHPYRRDLDEPPVLAAEGSARLLDYGGAGMPVLFVPSLINPAWIFDLSRRRSMLRYLRQEGVRPLLVDWGAPDQAEQCFGIDDYVRARLVPLLDRAAGLAGGALPVAGFCMGGNLALGAALIRPERVSRLAFLATPWDFHAEGPEQPALVADFARRAAPLLDAAGVLPADWQQLLFAALDPTLIEGKYRRFAGLPAQSPEAADFVALEDWAGGGAPLAAPVAQEVFEHWYGENRPARGQWRLGGMPADPARLAVPAWVAVAGRDRIVPPGSSRGLARALPQPNILEIEAGHVGMIVGGQAKRQTWQPLRDWLLAGRTLNTGLDS